MTQQAAWVASGEGVKFEGGMGSYGGIEVEERTDGAETQGREGTH